MMRRRRQTRREPTIALINVVFLLLVFFLVAGTLAPPLARDLSLVTTADLPAGGPPDALVVHADGRLSYRGEAVASVQDFLAARPGETAERLRLVPDRALPAATLIAVVKELRTAGAVSVMIVTERGLP